MSAEYWMQKIATYEREARDWETKAEKLVKRYSLSQHDYTRQNARSRFASLWSNVQTLRAATFARDPQPSVTRRFGDRDPVGRVAALILERALTFELEHFNDFRAAVSACLDDRLIVGRGVAWVRYEFKSEPELLPEQDEYGAEMGDVAMEGDAAMLDETPTANRAHEERITDESSPVEYVHWRDFGHCGGTRWDELRAVWRRVYLTRKQLVKRFGEKGAAVPLDGHDKREQDAGNETPKDTACIYEIWDREDREVIFIARSGSRVLSTIPDPLGLDEFFPCSAMYGTTTNDSLIPTPDFAQYKDQARSLDVLATRIGELAEMILVSGVYDASAPELRRLFTERRNGTLLPVNDWRMFSEKGGLQAGVQTLDLANVTQALSAAFPAFEQAKSQMYEVTGISDIVRGQGMASETATAQQIKGQYASLRLKQYQDEVARFASDLLRRKAQIMCKHYSVETLLGAAFVDGLAQEDMQYIGPALELLKGNDVTRTFRIQVAADSLVLADEQAEKDDRVEFLGAVSTFLERAIAAGQAAPEMLPLLAEMLKFGVGAFRGAETMEGTIDTLIANAMGGAQGAQALPAPDPAAQQQDAQAQAMQQQMVMQQQAIQQEAEQVRAEQEMQLEIYKADLDAKTKVAVAEIAAMGKVGAGGGNYIAQAISEAVRAGNSEATAQNAQTMQQLIGAIAAMVEQLGKPKRLVRGPDGRAIGVETEG